MRIDVERLSAVLPATELVEVLKNEIARLRLTDAERQAVGWAAEMLEVGSLPRSIHGDYAATLRGLLERIGQPPRS